MRLESSLLSWLVTRMQTKLVVYGDCDFIGKEVCREASECVGILRKWMFMLKRVNH